jgi:predicted LPLAT superfamily acyltransferase
MAHGWLHYRERGSVWAFWLIYGIARLFGRPLTRLLLYPICLYYMVCSPATVHASRDYLTRVFGRAARWREIFHHHLVFATALLDRAYVIAGDYDKFKVAAHGLDTVLATHRPNRGCLFLGAHVGSFEFMRIFGNRYHFLVNMIMHEDNAQKLAQVLTALDRDGLRRVIRSGRLETLLEAKECLDRGELVGMLADRPVATDQTVSVPFFGEAVAFPAGPFLAARALKAPVLLAFCLYRGDNRYEVFFESFAGEVTIARGKPEELTRWVRRYAERLEHYCRLDPYNWFNFYPYWGPPPAPDALPAASRH